MPKVTRAKIRQGLDSVPMETLILGVNNGQERTLTPKQKAFARAVALGQSKASAYRGAYSDKGSVKTQGNNGHALSKHKGIELEIAATQAALAAAEYQTPAKLRALVIHQLTQHAMNTSIAPAQRIKALQLLGTVSEVAAFTERKAVEHIQASGDVRARLLSTLSDVIKSQAIDITPNAPDADSLLAELALAKAPDAALAEPTHPPPASCAPARPCARSHTNPLKQSLSENENPLKQSVSDIQENISAANPDKGSISEIGNSLKRVLAGVDENISEEISAENPAMEIMPPEEEEGISLMEKVPPSEFVGKLVGGSISEDREGKDWRPVVVDGERTTLKRGDDHE